MSALLATASATFDFKGANITLACSSAQELLDALNRFGIQTAAANDTSTAATKAPKPPAASAASPTPAPTSAPAPAPAAASGSASGGETKAITYDDVKDRVLKLSKIRRELALEVLGKFTGPNGQPADHGNKVKLEDYPAFVAAADTAIAGAASA